MITAEDTPNPHALMFSVTLAALETTGTTPRSYRNAQAAEDAGDAPAVALFGAGPVAGVLILPRFVTVSKTTTARWSRLRPKIEAVLQEHRVPRA